MHTVYTVSRYSYLSHWSTHIEEYQPTCRWSGRKLAYSQRFFCSPPRWFLRDFTWVVNAHRHLVTGMSIASTQSHVDDKEIEIYYHEIKRKKIGVTVFRHIYLTLFYRCCFFSINWHFHLFLPYYKITFFFSLKFTLFWCFNNEVLNVQQQREIRQVSSC